MVVPDTRFAPTAMSHGGSSLVFLNVETKVYFH
jgi:hypothetical protein